MARPLGVDDVLHGRPRVRTMLWRGALRRCPRCGSRGVFRGWLKMKERCPSCGLLFEREPGFFIGVYFLNIVAAEGGVGLVMFGFIFWKATHPEAGVAIPVVLGVSIAIVAPIVFYPFARTIWSAIDLAMTPLELSEIVQAVDATEEPRDSDPGLPQA